MFLGVPFNIASYALLQSILANVLNLVPGEFVHTFGDLHLYANHKEQAELQLSREPKKLPALKIHGDQKEITDFNFEDFKILGSSPEILVNFEDFDLTDYHPHPAIKAPIAI